MKKFYLGQIVNLKGKEYEVTNFHDTGNGEYQWVTFVNLKTNRKYVRRIFVDNKGNQFAYYFDGNVYNPGKLRVVFLA